jgi:integrase/recombinase XerD
MSIKFFLKPFRKDKIKKSVCVRIIYNRTKAEMSTGLRTTEEDWNQIREQFKRSSSKNQKLAELEEKIFRAKHELDDRGQIIHAKEIIEAMLGKSKMNVRLVEWFESYISYKEEEGIVAKSTIKKYKNTLQHLKLFVKEVGKPNVSLLDTNLLIVNEFDEFLKNRSWNEYGEKMVLATINKHHSRLRTVLNAAIKKGVLFLNPYSNFKLSFPQGKREYLTSEELERIKCLDLHNNSTLDKTRDVFLFSCYTGLRYSDAMALSMNEVIRVSGKQYLRIDQVKTDERREIPLLGQAITIIEKYRLSKDRIVKDRVLPRMSNQKINHYLKLIATIAEIKKPLTHHIARHTCATTILLDNEVPLETVSHWLGHNNVRTTQIYAKISHANLEKERGRLDRALG